MKYIILSIAIFFITGCAFTSSQVAREVNHQQMLQYQQYAAAKAEATRAVMDALAKLDRGGMKIELDETGRVKAIKYTERLDPSILKEALATAQPKTYIPKSGIQEFGDFFLKFGSFATPVAAMWLNYKTAKSNNWANVEITKSNNERDTNMYNTFTSSYQNNIVKETTTITNTTTTTNDKEVTTTNNNNSGGNQNIGQTNEITPSYLLNDNYQNTTDSATTTTTDGTENINGIPSDCLPGTQC